MNTLYMRSDWSMEVKLSALFGNYDRQTDRPTNRPTDQSTDGHEGSTGSFTSIQ